MPYRITYQVNVDWVGAGEGPMSGNTAAQVGLSPAGGAQRLALFNAAGGQNSRTFLAADVTALTNAMAADIAAQMNVPATLARVQNFSTGTG
jgi:hypothetical protein